MKQETAEKAIVNGKALSLHEKDLVHITVGKETSMTKTQRQNALEKFALQVRCIARLVLNILNAHDYTRC